jgi:uncharacterized protein (TIGR02757 family)
LGETGVSIIKSALKLMKMMDNSPNYFLLYASKKEILPFKKFVYRTFNGEDCVYFIKSLMNIYRNYGGIEQLFNSVNNKDDKNLSKGIINFRKVFFRLPYPARIEKHFSDLQKYSPAKRINLFLRWMILNDNQKIDFGIWKNFEPHQLLCPLDTHSGRVARVLCLLNRKKNDLKSVIELTNKLKEFDPNDPVKYDFALFGLGIYENFQVS